MYTLKQVPADFVVCERSSVTFEKQGVYVYFELVKEGWNTIDLIRKIALFLGVAEREIGFAGIKDKQAVTKQFCSVRANFLGKLEQLKINGVTIRVVGYGNEPIRMGNLQGNAFVITIRNLDSGEMPALVDVVPNYFDEQRFSENNVAIGRYLLRKEFGAAAELIDRFEVREYLLKAPQDAVGALKKVSLRLLKLYTNAYQSFIWNRALSGYILRRGKNVYENEYSLGILRFAANLADFSGMKIPLVGFNQTESEDVLVQEIVSGVLKEEGLSQQHFVIKQIPELSLEGEMREAVVCVQDLAIGKLLDDELNTGKKKCMVSFFLPKGSYATMTIRAMMKN